MICRIDKLTIANVFIEAVAGPALSGEAVCGVDIDRADKPIHISVIVVVTKSRAHSVFIRTARGDSASSAIAQWLTDFGIVAKEVHCVGSDNGGDIAKAKRKVLLSIIENFDKVWFFDDDARNIELASDLPLKAKKV